MAKLKEAYPTQFHHTFTPLAAILKTTMEQAGQMYLVRVPVVAEVRITSSWATS